MFAKQLKTYTKSKNYDKNRDTRKPQNTTNTPNITTDVKARFNKFRQQNDIKLDSKLDSRSESKLDPQLTLIKTELIDYIYSLLNMSKYRYKLIEYESDLEALNCSNTSVSNTNYSTYSTYSYMVSPNYSGISCLVVFKKLNDMCYAYIIEKQKLSYSRRRVFINDVNIIKLEEEILDPKLFDGTIFDCILLFNKKTLILNDVYFFRGSDMRREKTKNKLLYMRKYFEKNKFNNIEIVINKLYELKDIGILVSTFIPNSKLSNSIKGLAFYPDTVEDKDNILIKLIYLFNNCSKDIIENIKNETTNDMFIFNKTLEDNVEIEDGRIAHLRLKQTETPDVYQLTLGSIIVKDNKKFMLYKQIGIACIPSLECSVMCKKLIENTDNGIIVMECKYHNGKWIPIKLSDKTKPDLYDEVFKKT